MAKKKTTEFKPVTESQQATPTIYLIKDKLTGETVEMQGAEWRINKDIYITLADYKQALENAAAGEKLLFKAGVRRYEFEAYKVIGKETVLTFADAKKAFADKTHTPPKGCSSC